MDDITTVHANLIPQHIEIMDNVPTVPIVPTVPTVPTVPVTANLIPQNIEDDGSILYLINKNIDLCVIFCGLILIVGLILFIPLYNINSFISKV